ncbi:hypothetical protein Tco_1263367 [Tanacetum coccineum]
MWESNGLSVVPGIANQHGNGNVVSARVEGNSNRTNGNQIRCYNYRGEGHYASNCTVKPRKPLLISSKTGAYEEIERKQPNCSRLPILSAKEADEFFGLITKAAELEIERLLRAVENEYAKLWNDWYKKCEDAINDNNFRTIKLIMTCNKRSNGCKLSWEISKGKVRYSHRYSNTLDPLPQKLENENVELEFQVRNYEKENAHLKTTYKNLFDSIKVTRAQTKALIDSLQDKLHDTIYENAKLRAQLFDKVISECLSKPVTSNSAPSSRESTVVNNERVIAPGIFRIDPFKASRYVNGMKSRKKNQSANVLKSANQKKHKPKVWIPKKVGSKEILASPKPSTPRSCLRWLPTGRMFNLKGNIISTSEYVCQSDCSKGDNTCTSNPQEPIYKRFPSSTFSMTGCQNWLDTLLIPLLSEYKPKDKENHRDNE